MTNLRRGGVFEVHVDGMNIWSRKKEGKFPEAKERKQRVHDVIAPQKVLGHSESKV